MWRVWAPAGTLSDGVRAVEPDFQDAVVAAALAVSGRVARGTLLRPSGEGELGGDPGRSPPVSRRFGAFTAVSGTDLVIGPGEVVGLLGANGAGKTTLIRMLLGLVRPARGISLSEPPSIATRRRVGYVPQTLGLYAGLTVAENWAFTGRLRHPGHRGAVRDSGWRSDLVGDLPLGAQRQVAFAVARSHQPELLILDEPTSGVGPLGGARLWEEIRQAAVDGGGAGDHAQPGGSRAVRPPRRDGGGEIVATGTAAQITGARTVTEVRCADAPGLRAARRRRHCRPGRRCGVPCRLPGSAGADLLAIAGIEATASSVPAILEEEFVAIVTSRWRHEPDWQATGSS